MREVTMKKFEITILINFEEARDLLAAGLAAFVKRSQIDDLLFVNDAGDVARLRRQDTITRLSCTKPLLREGPAENCETIVLDFRACLRLLLMFGFRESARERLTRETWKKCHYALHLDRLQDGGDRLTLEAEAWHENDLRMKRQAVKFLKSMGIACKIKLKRCDIAKPPAAAYTAPIVRDN